MVILYEAVFTDAYSAGRGQVEIVDSVYPDFVESTIMVIPEPMIKRACTEQMQIETILVWHLHC